MNIPTGQMKSSVTNSTFNWDGRVEFGSEYLQKSLKAENNLLLYCRKGLTMKR